MASIETYYMYLCNESSDINEHLPTLKEYASKCNSVVECGVRTIVSSYAFALGLKGNPENKLLMVDPEKSPNMNNFLLMCKKDGINCDFFHGSDLDCPLVQTDLLFIDTWHVYGQLKRELNYWHSSVSKYIIMHDTTVDESLGETIRMRMNAEKQSLEFNMPIEEINKGLWPAIEEFLKKHPEWIIEKRFTNNNGLTILKRT